MRPKIQPNWFTSLAQPFDSLFSLFIVRIEPHRCTYEEDPAYCKEYSIFMNTNLRRTSNIQCTWLSFKGGAYRANHFVTMPRSGYFTR